MRRARSYKPDMFPFLAVLLCTMGSLILVLLVLDRQARKMARHRAEAKVALLQEKMREEEWQQRQKRWKEIEAHNKEMAFLRARYQKLTTKRKAKKITVQKVQKQLQEVKQAVYVEKERKQNLLVQMDTTRSLIAHLEDAIANKKRELQALEQQVEKDETRRQSLLEGVKSLEKDLLQLQKKTKQGEERWSIVPYAGKRGDNRAPIYVECASEGLIFHPDGKKISGGKESIPEIRNEVLQRRRQYLVLDRDTDRSYWMLLVRPNGITRYYQFRAAVQGLDILFGYELIDSKWKLSFPLAKEIASSDLPKRGGGGSGGPGFELGSPVSATDAMRPLTDPAKMPLGSGRQPGRGVTLPRAGEAPGNAQSVKGQPPQKLPNAVTGAPIAKGQPEGKPDNGTGNSRRGSQDKPLRPANPYGDPDWELIVECSADEVKITPSGLIVSVEELETPQGAEKLRAMAKRLIDRQATRLRARKSEHRPRILFVVGREALRTYHIAYPVLNSIPVPKTAVMREP